MLGGLTLDEYQHRWEDAVKLIQSSELNESTVLSIKQCSAEILSQKLEDTTAKLMEVRNQISYTARNRTKNNFLSQ